MINYTNYYKNKLYKYKKQTPCITEMATKFLKKAAIQGPKIKFHPCSKNKILIIPIICYTAFILYIIKKN